MLVTGHSVHFSFITLLFLFLFTKNIAAQVYPNPEVDSLLRCGISLIVEQKYNDAKIVFTQLDSNYPELPLGNIYLAAAEIARCYDFELGYTDEYILSNLQKADMKAQSQMNNTNNEKWNIYFSALVHGYTAYYYALQGSWLKALDLGLSSVSEFEKCLDLDPDFYEALTAIGTYEYWKSRKTEFLSWLPFVSDNRKSGVEKLKKAVQHSGYNSHIALHSLIWIYIDQADYDSAFALAQFAVEKYPDSRIFKWGLARSLEEINIQESVNSYNEVLASYQKSGIRSIVNEITLKHIIAQQYVKLGENETAKTLCEEILNYKDLTEFEQDKLENRIDRVKVLLSELSKY